MKKLLLNSVITLATVVVSFAYSVNAQAQIQFQGTAKFNARQSGSLVSATASVSQVANYTSESFSGVTTRLVLSNKPHRTGSDLFGTTVAKSTTLATFAARTIYNGVNLSGSANCSRGRKSAILVLTDFSSRILAFYNFKGTVSVRKIERAAKRALKVGAATAPSHFIEN